MVGCFRSPTADRRELGSDAQLPSEIEAAMELVCDPNRGYRWPGFAEGFLRATDAALVTRRKNPSTGHFGSVDFFILAVSVFLVLCYVSKVP